MSIFNKPIPLFLCALIGGPVAHAADLTVIIDNVKENSGQVMLGLFDSAEAFPRQIFKGLAIAWSEKDVNGSVRFLITDLKPGQYAASAYHDLDGNSKLNTNLLRLPTEPYGFSNNAHGSFGPPSFKDAAFSIGDTNLTIRFEVK
jgi:uncharacterized protein (DUF2141 family)